ncbi:hypothetical protein SK128_003965, partial [Halocaridina rubra]
MVGFSAAGGSWMDLVETTTLWIIIKRPSATFPKISEYPLAVKLGTITQDGTADVYSYDEDDMVLDPNLVKHLA